MPLGSKFSTLDVTAKHILSNNFTVLDLRRRDSGGTPHFRTNTLSSVCSVIQVLGGSEVTSGQRFCHVINLEQIVITEPDHFFLFNEVKLFMHGETAVSKFKGKGKGKESVKDATFLVDYFRYSIDFSEPVSDYTCPVRICGYIRKRVEPNSSKYINLTYYQLLRGLHNHKANTHTGTSSGQWVYQTL